MTGIVHPPLVPTLSVTVLSPDGQRSTQVDFLVDTGYDGYATLTPALVAALALPLHARQQATLADGSTIPVDVHSAALVWDGVPLPVYVEVIDSPPLLGLMTLFGNELRIEAVPGGAVTTRPIP